MSIRSLSLFLTLILFAFGSFAQDEHESHAEEGGGADVSDFILHHVLDSHDWHITDIPAGKDEHGHQKYLPISIHLPWLFYSSRDGLVFATGTEDLIEKGYLPFEEELHALSSGVDKSKIHLDHGHVHMNEHDFEEFAHSNIDEAVSITDLSIGKTTFQMLLIGILLLFVFISVARGYAKNEGKAPKGIQSFFEPIIVFIRDDVAKTYLHEHAPRFIPYLLTLFFFIWFSNLFGLTPFNSNITGNISVTASLAVLTFLITQFNGSKDHWKHVFNTPGVPWVLKFGIPLMPVVEIIGLFTKPFALAIRLFANITAGHFMVLGIIGMIFILSNGGQNVAAGITIAPFSVLLTLGIFCLEMIVAIIQAYIFTLLTAVFIGMALETHDDHH